MSINKSTQSIEKLLRDGETVEFSPIGWSMYPLIRPDIDTVIVEPVEAGKWIMRGDVLLYRRAQSILVLHRLYQIFPDGYYFVGDNQTEIEGPLKKQQILGRAVAIRRNGKKLYRMNHPIIFLYSGAWLFVRPLRPYIGRAIHRLKVCCREGIELSKKAGEKIKDFRK